MTIGLSIVFTGLCALVTDGQRGSGQVLLVDAKGIGEVGGVVLPEHAPTLVVSLASLANAESSRPTRVVMAWPGEGAIAERTPASPGLSPSPGQIGLWDLSGSEVRIRVQGGAAAGLRVFRPADGASSWPQPPHNANDPASWRDVRFVADMTALAGDGRVNPALVAVDDASSAMPRSVAARIQLDAGLVEAGIPSQENYRDDVFEFRSSSNEPRLRQALTDTIRWSLETDASAVVIEIAPVAGGPVKRLVLNPRATSHSLFISNLPAENVSAHAHHAVSSEELAALHFGAYYKLLRNSPADQPLPRVWTPALARRGAGLMHTAFCPPAAFTRE
jgi:hypothetical protein